MKSIKSHNKNLLWVLAVCLVAFPSCRKLIDVDPPADQLTTAQVFSTNESATAAVNGLYSEIMEFNKYIGNGAMSLYPALSADEITGTTADPSEDVFAGNAVPPTNTAVSSNMWAKAYHHVYQANVIIENLLKSTGVSNELKKQLTGEAKFMRAFFHFYLTNLFGPVPLAIKPDYEVNASLPRSDSAAVYTQIVADLKDAQSILREDYPTGEKVRVNKWAATAMLARVCLYRKDWTEAATAASSVINSSLYRLASLEEAFLPDNPEAILQFLPAITQIFNSSEGFSFLPFFAGFKPSYKLTPTLLGAFEAADRRKGVWVKSDTVGGEAYAYPYKYKVKWSTPGEQKREYNVVLRLAEQYLIRAEARVNLNDIAGARSDLDVIRTRAGLDGTAANDKASLLLAVEKERQAELFCEWGHRWFDLKRTGRADAVLAASKSPGWQTTDQLYPVPQSEIQANPKLTQNPGY